MRLKLGVVPCSEPQEGGRVVPLLPEAELGQSLMRQSRLETSHLLSQSLQAEAMRENTGKG